MMDQSDEREREKERRGEEGSDMMVGGRRMGIVVDSEEEILKRKDA